ncbi:HAD family hydrolase [Pseudorhodoferax sp.]|uniref:HAD family hydrolase n=1 Tax=Pseudorhodoferax sp. TaxID=1993553 RepID=UPI002DD65486|nr:HAD-IB family hydrolase [Pseudorhodoferax sp.]
MNRTARLALFDLDNTLLTGDSEVLWVEFLLARGALDAALAARNAELDRRYHAGQVAPDEFCAFYAATFGGRTPAQWAAWLDAFAQEVVLPRLPLAAHELVQQHRAAGDRLVLTTASSRPLAQPSADALGLAELIATELAQHADGRFTGQVRGVPNMREGKLARLRHWLATQGLDADAALARAVFYSDSVNDLPLLLAVGEPVAVDPDARLAQEAAARRWPVLRLARTDSFPAP